MINKDPIKLSREILNSGTYLNQWEKNFLNNIKSCIKKFGYLTEKQTHKLRSIANKTHTFTKYKPEKQKSNIIALQLEDLKIKADKLTDKEKIFVRKQLKQWNQYQEPKFLDKQNIFKLHQKYYSN